MLNKELKREKLYDIIVKNPQVDEQTITRINNALDGFNAIDRLLDENKPLKIVTLEQA